MAEKTNKKERSFEEDNQYLVSYTRHLERRIRTLETEKQLLEADKIKLDRELRAIKVELDRMKKTPLVTADVVDVLEDGRVVVKSSTGPQFVVHASGIIPRKKLSSGARVALNQRNFAITEVLPSSKDPLVQAMEVEEAPIYDYADVGGLKDQINEIRETIEYPFTHPELYEQIGIDPPKGVLLCGPPGTGKTLLAKAVAHETKATFVRIIGSELVQKFIGEGARLVREVFQLAKEKAPAIVFIDELDAIGCKRLEVATSGDREVQRTLMQLLSTLDGFESRGDVRILAATNRPDILDEALLRPGRFDRIITFDYPDEKAKNEIFRIHSRNMNLEKPEMNFNDIITLYKKNPASKKIDMKATVEKVSGADIKAICTEAGMFAIRRYLNLENEMKNGKIPIDDYEKEIKNSVVKEEDFLHSIIKVLERKQELSVSDLYT